MKIAIIQAWGGKAVNSVALRAQGCYIFVFSNGTYAINIFIVFVGTLELLKTHIEDLFSSHFFFLI